MLLQFTVENFSSIKDKVFLSLEPSKTKLHPENLIRKNNHTAVNVIAIYGANVRHKCNEVWRGNWHGINMVCKKSLVMRKRLCCNLKKFDKSIKKYCKIRFCVLKFKKSRQRRLDSYYPDAFFVV